MEADRISLRQRTSRVLQTSARVVHHLLGKKIHRQNSHVYNFLLRGNQIVHALRTDPVQSQADHGTSLPDLVRGPAQNVRRPSVVQQVHQNLEDSLGNGDHRRNETWGTEAIRG